MTEQSLKVEELQAEIKQLKNEVERLGDALELIAESSDAGRHDGLPEECPALDAHAMWKIANDAIWRKADVCD